MSSLSELNQTPLRQFMFPSSSKQTWDAAMTEYLWPARACWKVGYSDIVLQVSRANGSCYFQSKSMLLSCCFFLFMYQSFIRPQKTRVTFSVASCYTAFETVLQPQNKPLWEQMWLRHCCEGRWISGAKGNCDAITCQLHQVSVIHVKMAALILPNLLSCSMMIIIIIIIRSSILRRDLSRAPPWALCHRLPLTAIQHAESSRRLLIRPSWGQQCGTHHKPYKRWSSIHVPTAPDNQQPSSLGMQSRRREDTHADL